jgi:hypothetical protein
MNPSSGSSDLPDDHCGTASFRDDPFVPLGRASFSLVVTLAGARIRLDSFPVSLDPFVVEHYPGHHEVGEGEADLVLSCSVDETGTTFVPPPSVPGEEIRIVIERSGDSLLRIRLLNLSAEIDFERRSGTVVFSDLRYVPFRTSLENLLRIAFSWLLVRRRAFLFHCAGIVRNGRAWLFFGPSGSGKSTITWFSRELPALSDDLIAVDLSGEAPLACRVPFYGLFPPETRAGGDYPVGALFRLRQAPPGATEDRIVPLSPVVASAQILGSLPFVNDPGAASPETIELAFELASRVPVAELAFRRSPRFWDAIDCWAAAGFPR